MSDAMVSADLVPERSPDLTVSHRTVGVVGLGYVGLPLATAMAKAGCDVRALDVDSAKIDSLLEGTSYIEDVPDSLLASISSNLTPTLDPEVLKECDDIVITVPTPLTNSREPDFTYLDAATETITEVIRPGQLVAVESTTYPGTTRERVLPKLARDDFRVGVDFFLAFSPERIDPGRKDFDVKTTPKLVGGITPACTERAKSLYESVCENVVVTQSPEVAEMAKLLENVFRSVNIALVNELAQLCDVLGIDVWEVIDAASTKPFGFMRFDPGPGMGGHCLPIDPFYLAYRAREKGFYPEFIELAGKINQSQPEWCVRKIQRALNEAGKPVKGAKILILGVSYKAGVADTRESPALKIIERLMALGADVRYSDPYVPSLPLFDLRSEDGDIEPHSYDLAAIITAHPEMDYDHLSTQICLIEDFRGVRRHD